MQDVEAGLQGRLGGEVSAQGSIDRGDLTLDLAQTLPAWRLSSGERRVDSRFEAPGSPEFLFHPDLSYWDTRTGYPALVAIVRNAAGERVAIHRT